MKSTHSMAGYLLFAVAALLLAACSTHMKAAQQALDQISNAVEAIPADSDQYVPDQIASVRSKLNDLNASFDKKDYRAVLDGAPAVLAEAKNVAATAVAKRDEAMKALTSQWNQLSSSVPQLVASVKTRVDALSKTRRVPKGVDLPAAKAGLDSATTLWQKAQTAFQSKQVADAVTDAKDAMTRAEAAASSLKMG